MSSLSTTSSHSTLTSFSIPLKLFLPESFLNLYFVKSNNLLAAYLIFCERFFSLGFCDITSPFFLLIFCSWPFLLHFLWIVVDLGLDPFFFNYTFLKSVTFYWNDLWKSHILNKYSVVTNAYTYITIFIFIFSFRLMYINTCLTSLFLCLAGVLNGHKTFLTSLTTSTLNSLVQSVPCTAVRVVFAN